MASFDARKRTVLQSLASDERDKSRAGGVDAPIADLIARINLHPCFFTTSSCSGRISVFSESSLSHKLLPVSAESADVCVEAVPAKESESVGNGKRKKKGGDWVYVSHEPAVEEEVIKNVQEYCSRMEDGLLVFRFEPFILALECRTPASAQLLVTCALSAGFRESGIMGMGKRNIVGIRCSIRLEVPIAEAGQLLVSQQYLQFLTVLANQKMELNRQRIQVFFKNFVDQVEGSNLWRLSEVEFDIPVGEATCGSPRCDDLQNHGVEKQGIVTRGKSVNHGARGLRARDQPLAGNSAGNKENKKKLSALKGRQLRALARVRLLEERLLQTTVGNGGWRVGFHVITSIEGENICSDPSTPRPIIRQGPKELCNLEHVSKNGSGDSNTRIVDSSVSRANFLQWSETKSASQTGGVKSDGCSLPAVRLAIHGEPVERLHCWSHSAVYIRASNGEPSIVIHGGFGGQGRHERQGKTLVLNPVTGDLKCLETTHARLPRMAHIAVLVDDNMVMIGGRQDPSTCLGDVCVLDLKTNSWSFPEVTGSEFLPRHRHAAAMVGSSVYVFGGLGENTILGDLCLLNTKSWKWEVITCEGDVPCPRHSHSLAVIDQRIYLFGGRDARRVFGDLHVFCPKTNTWTQVNGVGDLFTPRFSHSMTAVGKWLVILGGCPIAKHRTDLFLFDIERMASKKVSLVQAPSDVLLVRHTVTLLGSRLVIIGGGAACFAFGAKFNSPLSVDLKPFFDDESITNIVGMDVADQSNQTEMLMGGLLATSKERKTQEECTWILKLARNSAKVGKDALKQLGWLDQNRKPKVLNQGSYVAFPIIEAAASFLQVTDMECMSNPLRTVANGSQQLSLQEILLKLVAAGGEVAEMQLAYDSNCPIPPLSALATDVSKLLQEVGLPQSLLGELPKRWERLGDMAILPAGSLDCSSWTLMGSVLWTTIASALGAKRIARQAPVAATKTRDSRLHVLWGEGGWVEHRENGILYCLDATKCMFSSGNISEKLRMAAMNCAGETVVDLFAGIGYYVLPFLLKAGARKVYACEWNPHAIVALHHNLQVNGVEDRCVVIEGDNRLTAPQGVADRVCLGLLPSSEGSWNIALKALRPEGGILHVHENVKDTAETEWLQYLVLSLHSLSTALGRDWEVRILHVERVKWYAPHIRHLVVDIQCH